MDNYLAHRWPDGTVSETRRAVKKTKKTKKKKGRAGRVLLIILLILVILAGVGVGSWFLAREFIPRLLAVEVEESSGGSVPTQSHDSREEPVITPALERAEIVEGVTLRTERTTGAEMLPREIYEQVLPSVVSVTVYRGESMGYGAGSGVIMREDGYILTNYHILEYGQEAHVMLLEDNSSYPARLVGYDEELDLAILKIDAEGLRAARFGDSDALSVGDPAYAIGNPMGYLYGSMSEGIISFLDRSHTVGDYDMTLIQTTAVLNSGNSGGALVNQYGQVIGITVAKVSGSVSGSALVEGIGFAIPISAVRPYVDRILATGESWRPTIGITCYAAEADGVGGIFVATVEKGTPAFKAGLKEMDFIIAANGQAVDSVQALKRVLGEVGVGGMLTCTILRDGERMEVAFALIDSSDLDE